MPREIITIQVGQCGNQIGLKFWELALKEHAEYNKSLIYDEALSSFFRNVETKNKTMSKDLPIGSQITDLKARAIVVDMEQNVINNKILNGEFKDLFEGRQCISDQSGAGNNWACGHYFYGNQYKEEIREKVRQSVEHCDSLQGFFFTHSLGGGTGSGLGSYIVKDLADEYPTVFRFSACVFPSEDDDVITSPYNSMLALNVLIEHADCVLPVDNQALFDIVGRVDQQYQQQAIRKGDRSDPASMIKQGSAICDQTLDKNGKMKQVRYYERENSIVAHVINNLTCSMRFEGDLNVDLNEITMNLVPFPKMHFLLSSLSPIYSFLQPQNKLLQPRGINETFNQAFDKQNQLIQQANPQESLYLATGLIVRGPNVEISDITRNVENLQKKLKMVPWNKEGFKVGHCYQAPLNQPYSILALSNNTCIRQIMERLRARFMKIYKKRVFAHHYTEYMPEEQFDIALNNCTDVIQSYQEMEERGIGHGQMMGVEDYSMVDTYRFKPLV